MGDPATDVQPIAPQPGDVELTIVIPTRGPSSSLTELLRSIHAALPAEVDIGVIVVVDGPMPELGCFPDDALSGTTLACTGVRRGPGAARNLGFSLTSTEHVVFLDDDVLLPEDWFGRLDATLRTQPDVGLLGARLTSVARDNLVSRTFETFIVRNERRRGRWFLASAFLAVRREAFVRLGGFDERLADSGEDWDLCRRAHALNVAVHSEESLEVHHRNPTRFRELLSRSALYARSFGVAAPLTPEDSDRPLTVGRFRLPSGSAALRPWVRAVKSIVVSLPSELARRSRIAFTRDLPWRRRFGVLLLHVPWFLDYWMRGTLHELRRNRAAVRRSP